MHIGPPNFLFYYIVSEIPLLKVDHDFGYCGNDSVEQWDKQRWAQYHQSVDPIIILFFIWTSAKVGIEPLDYVFFLILDLDDDVHAGAENTQIYNQWYKPSHSQNHLVFQGPLQQIILDFIQVDGEIDVLPGLLLHDLHFIRSTYIPVPHIEHLLGNLELLVVEDLSLHVLVVEFSPLVDAAEKANDIEKEEVYRITCVHVTVETLVVHEAWYTNGFVTYFGVVDVGIFREVLLKKKLRVGN